MAGKLLCMKERLHNMKAILCETESSLYENMANLYDEDYSYESEAS